MSKTRYDYEDNKMSDLVDRKLAIRAINNVFAVTPTQIDTVNDCIDAINSLPSA